MSLAWISTVTVGCILMASLALSQDYRRRDFRKFSFNKATRPTYNNQGHKGGKFGAYRVISSYSGTPGNPKVAYPYNNQPGYIGSKTGYNEYNGNRQGNYPYSVKGNKGGNTDLHKGPYGVTQGTLTVADAYKNQPSYTESIKNSHEYNQYNNQPNNGPNTDLHKGPYGVNQGGLTVTAPYNNQPGYIGIDPYIKNSPENNQYGNQDNKGSDAGVYGGNQVGPQVGYDYKN